METKIFISGQINGNYTLRNKLTNYDEIRNGMFNSFYLIYSSKKDAQKDLAQAKKLLKNESDNLARCNIYRSNGRPYKLTYDASKAEIIEN